MRIVTRPDFDGVICAVLLQDVMDISEPILWIEPYEIKNNFNIIKEGDIISNLPYVDNCSLWFDHHYSNKTDKQFKGRFKIAPSAARIIYEYYTGKFSKDFDRTKQFVIEEQSKYGEFAGEPIPTNVRKFERIAQNYSEDEIESVIVHAKEEKLKEITELAQQLTIEELTIIQERIK